MIHIEGMGWLGSALARALAHANVEFTWSDTDAEFCAWPACTGIVYPAGDARSQTNLAAWTGWLNQGLFTPQEAHQVAYCYTHQHPPHQGRYTATDLGWLRIAHAPCYSVNVPEVVTTTRFTHADRRILAVPPGLPRVIAHGYNERRTSYMWGWSARVRIDLPAELTDALDGRTPAFYARKDRFQMIYAYPVPGESGTWWAGSSLVGTKTARPRPDVARDALNRWIAAFPTCYPKLALSDVEDPVEGWRPRAAAEDGLRLRYNPDGTLLMPPLWHSGVRWAPDLINQAVAQLRATQLKGSA